MRRKTLDTLLAATGLVVAAMLVAAGGMLAWAHSFVNDQVTTQLTAQQIFFPEEGSESLNNPEVKPHLEQYAGQQLTTGAQARAYADHFIKVHIDAMTGGQTYSQLSAQAQASPDDPQLAGQVQTVFRGETLRGLLLNSYAFWKMGQIAWIGALVSFAAAALMLILSLLGMRHARHTPEDTEVLVGQRKHPVTA